MVTIIFSRKGGAGKSTLAAQLAAALACLGFKVAVIDTDPLGTVGNWGGYRSEHKGIPGITFLSTKHGKDLDYAIQNLSKKHDHIIVDLQGGDTKENRATLLHADKVILPFKPTQPDLDNLPYVSKMLAQLKQTKPAIDLHYVLNEARSSNARVSPVDQAREYFAAFEIEPAGTVIHRRKAYEDSMATGMGACELKDKKAKAEIEGLWSEIYHRRSSDKRSPRVTTVTQRKKA